MSRTALKLFLCAVPLSLLGMRAFGHHSAVMFDDKKVIELTGVVKDFQWANPHTWLIISVINKDGTQTTWGFEAPAGPSILMRAGLHRGDLPPGTAVRVSGHPMRDGRHAAQWLTVRRLRDGKEWDPTKGI